MLRIVIKSIKHEFRSSPQILSEGENSMCHFTYLAFSGGGILSCVSVALCVDVQFAPLHVFFHDISSACLCHPSIGSVIDESIG